MTREEALAKMDTRWWETATDREIVEFQLYEERLCMPFSEFHRAMGVVLDRPVYTHEFARQKWLQDEFEGKREPLDPLDSLRAIAPDKEIIVLLPEAK